MLLAGDIGGTKTNLAIYTPESGPRRPLQEATFVSARYPSLEAVVREFLSQAALPVEKAVFGVAGPVVEGQSAITNLPWVMDERQMQDTLNLSAVRLLNDLVSIAHAVPVLKSSDLCTLNEGEPSQEGAMAVIAPGTGLGEAFLTRGELGAQAHPSEGGHADFAPTNALQVELLRYLLERFEHVSYERVCSGLGLPNLYTFLRDRDPSQEPGWLTQRLAEADDPTPVIVNTALDQTRPCALCKATLDLFVSILGAEASNLALKTLATGGVYLGGGIPPRILPALQQGKFMPAFCNKGRFSDLMALTPVHVILNAKAPLLGVARYGLEQL